LRGESWVTRNRDSAFSVLWEVSEVELLEQSAHMLSKEALDEYREIYRNEHGEVPPDEVLVEEAIKLLTVFDLIYRPIKKDWLEAYEKNHNHHEWEPKPQQSVEEEQKSQG
jgi:hypothetical protein